MPEETSNEPKTAIVKTCEEPPEKTEKHAVWDKCSHRYISTVEDRWSPRTEDQCLECGKVFRDMEHYIIDQTRGLDVDTVIDVGSGLKGPVAEAWWNREKDIAEGWIVDIWETKPMGPPWHRLEIDARNLLNHFEPDSVDAVVACGFLEHVPKKDGFEIVEILERIASKFVFISCATVQRDVMWKVRKDGNPYHKYLSCYSMQDFEDRGYITNRDDFMNYRSFTQELMAWKHLADPEDSG